MANNSADVCFKKKQFVFSSAFISITQRSINPIFIENVLTFNRSNMPSKYRLLCHRPYICILSFIFSYSSLGRQLRNGFLRKGIKLCCNAKYKISGANHMLHMFLIYSIELNDTTGALELITS